jgi:sigma-B regulation protein RsbU (phosphoserine phosphatase)
MSFPADFAAGDYFDYFEMPGGTWSIAIGDVSGHGFSSALLMASIHAHLRSLAETGIGVAEILARANSSLVKTTAVGDFITVMLASLDPRSRELIYSSAGHTTGFVLDETGNMKNELTSSALPLAVLSDSDYVASETIALEPGDIVLMLTDGVLEAASKDDEDFGEERILRFVRDNRHKPAVEIAEGLCRAARDFNEDDEHQDDVTAVVIKVKSDS